MVPGLVCRVHEPREVELGLFVQFLWAVAERGYDHQHESDDRNKALRHKQLPALAKTFYRCKAFFELTRPVAV